MNRENVQKKSEEKRITILSHIMKDGDTPFIRLPVRKPTLNPAFFFESDNRYVV